MDSAAIQLLVGAILTIIQVFVTGLPGALFARSGVVNADVRRGLSRIAFNLLLPAVTFVNVGPWVNFQNFLQWWPVLINVTLSMLMGLAAGAIGSKILGIPKKYIGAAIACSGFGNMNSLPLMLVNALCYSDKLPFGGNDRDQCNKLATALVALGSSSTSIFSYSLATWLLSPSEREDHEQCDDDVDGEEDGPLLLEEDATASRNVNGASPGDGYDDAERGKRHATRDGRGEDNALTAPLLAGDELNTAAAAAAAVNKISSAYFNRTSTAGESANAQGEPGNVVRVSTSLSQRKLFLKRDSVLFIPSASLRTYYSEFEPPVTETTPQVPMETPPAVEHVIKKIKDSWWVVLIHAIWKAVTATIDFILLLLPPPALASLVGILVGIVTPLRELFFPMGKAPLTWLTASIETWGKAMVFTSSFVLGAVLSKGPGQGVKRVGVRTVASIVLIRLVLTPILGKAIVFMTYFLGWWKLPTVGGYTFFFILLLQQCMPTANNMQNISSMLEYNEKEVGAILFWQYLLSLITIPLWMTIDMYMMRQWGILPSQ